MLLLAYRSLMLLLAYRLLMFSTKFFIISLQIADVVALI